MSRPKKSDQKSEPIPPYLTSMAAAAKFLCVPRRRLSQAKAAGCDAFESNRVHTLKLIRFLFSAEGGQDWKAIYEEFRAKRERLDHDKDAGHLIDKYEVGSDAAAIGSRVKETIIRVMVDELPPKLEGLRAAEMTTKIRAALDPLFEQIREAAKL